MNGGYMGRIGFVDLSSGEIREEKLDETLGGQFIGGYGLGVRQNRKTEVRSWDLSKER